jgi:hypothetical protein
MGRVVTNDVSATIPEIWLASLQENLYKTLVSFEIANTELSDVKYCDTIRKNYFGNLSAQTYTPGTPLSATNLDFAMDALVCSAIKHCTFYLDDINELQSNISKIAPLAEEAAYQLKNAIDSHVLKCITGADGFLNFGMDAAGFQGGTAHRPVSAGSAVIIDIFTNATKKLAEGNVEMMGDWIAIVTPKIAMDIVKKAMNTGFSFADAALKNGFVGEFAGFKVYISNNLPSGKCSSVSPTLSTAAVSATTCKSIYFGRNKMIDLAMQRTPTFQINKCEDKLGYNYITSVVWGDTVFTRNRSRGLNVGVQSSYY